MPAVSQQTSQQGGRPWRDPHPLNPDWDPPRWHDRFPARVKVAALVVVLALVAGGLWGAGAFERESTVHEVDWRTPVVTGPVEVTVLRALFEDSEYSKPKVRLEALCRLVVPSATRVQSLDLKQGVGLTFDGKPVKYEKRYVKFGTDGSDGVDRMDLAPRVQPTPCMIEGELLETQGAAPFVRVAFLNQQYVARGFAAKGEKQWVVVRGGSVMNVPVQVLPQH